MNLLFTVSHHGVSNVMKKLLFLAVFVCCLALCAGEKFPKYIILFIGDGMASPQRMVAEEFAVKSGYGKLAMNHLPFHATTRTASANSLVTDSAAAGTAIACGEKTDNQRIGVGPDGKGNNVLLLNGKPYYHHGLLDQGYYKGGFYTPSDDSDFVNDISTMKAMGFNTLRKHIKVEPLRWYYHCDTLGMLVWQDMVSGGGHYRPSVITAPLVFGSHLKDDRYDKFAREDEQARKVWEQEAYDTVRTLYNCTCVCMWVPFNEGWGQFDSVRICENIRRIDDSRTIDHASGWQDQGYGDFRSLHVYFRPYRFRRDSKGRAVILTEFGGYGMDTNTTSKKTFIYRRFRTKDELTRAIVRLYEKQIIPARKKGLAASIYTQVSDVEQEVNGLLSYDRKQVKVDVKEIARMSGDLMSV